MINANELSIGNWVYDGEMKRNCMIAEVRLDSVFLDPSPYAGTKLSWLMPIPLTPSILEKAGFEKEEDGDGGYYHELLSENGVLFVEGNKKGYTDVFLDMDDKIRVRCLHQLQNLYFALTGTELTINL